MIEQAGIGREVGARRAADRLLVDDDEAADLVKAGNDPLIKRVGAGDTLPDGSRLVSVGTNGILIDRDGCRMRRPLYPAPEQDKTSGECLPAGNDRGQ